MSNPLDTIYSGGLVDVEYVTQNAIFEGMYDTEEHDRVMHFVIKALKDINIFHVVNKKVVKLTVGALNTVTLPDDYVDYLKIGTVFSNGLFWTFTKADSLSMAKTFDCGEEQRPNEQLLQVAPANTRVIFDNYKKINTYYNYTGGNNTQYFRIDKENNRIVLKTDNIGSEIEMEYVTTGINTTGDTIVPVMYNDTLVAFALWQMKLRTPRVPANEIEMSRQEWVRNFNKLNSALMASTKSEWLDMIYSHWKRTLKPSA